ncbi:hypothetical protein [Tolumonas lignilytica]|uniref:hypothetical protein n=1 Tax=Tolumonas lignilytica TaxID=1283284 RepID=UPI0004639DFB|nr:hypothetical protein [Tolumonas lignilytica]
MSDFNIERIVELASPDAGCEIIYAKKRPSIKWSDSALTVNVDCIMERSYIDLLNTMSHVAISREVLYGHDCYVFDFYDFEGTLIPPGFVFGVEYSDKLLEHGEEGKRYFLELTLEGERIAVLPAIIERIIENDEMIH